MTAQHDLDRQLEAYLRDGPTELPDPSFDAVRDRIEGTQQRAVIGPWRMPDIMNKYVPIAVGAAAVVVAVVAAAQVLGSPAPGGAGAASQATPSPTAAAASASPSASPAAPPALTETFTSDRNGISISYPAGWVARPATEPWTSSIPDFMSTGGDVIYHPTLEDHLWLMIASQPLAGKGGEQWVNDLFAELGSTGECGSPGDAVTVDGTQGRWCGDNTIAVPSGDRGYAIKLYTSGDDPAVGATYDQAWFEEVLATVQLRPEDARDVALTEVPRLPESGPVNPGTYRMGTEPEFLVTIPPGWVSSGRMSLRKNLDQPNEVELTAYTANTRVFADACKSEGSEQPVGPTAEDLVAALEAQANSEVSDPVEVTVAGLAGIRLEITAPAGLDVAECSIGSLQIWVDQEGGGGYLAGVGLDDTPVAVVYVVDTPGGRLAFVPHQGNATPADIAERDAIIESIRFEP